MFDLISLATVKMGGDSSLARLVAALFALVGIVMVVSHIANAVRCKREVVGSVVSVKELYSKNSSAVRYLPTYEYEYDGITYTATATTSKVKKPNIGDTEVFKINEENPEQASFSAKADLFVGFLMIGLSILIMVALLNG